MKPSAEERKQKLLEASKLFRKKTRGMTLKDILKETEKIRKEIYDEWFGDRK